MGGADQVSHKQPLKGLRSSLVLNLEEKDAVHNKTEILFVLITLNTAMKSKQFFHKVMAVMQNLKKPKHCYHKCTKQVRAFGKHRN